MITNDFTPAAGYSTFDNYPRLVGDFNGDGMTDIVGFSSSGTKIAFANRVCTHSSRDSENECSCKAGFYELGDG